MCVRVCSVLCVVDGDDDCGSMSFAMFEACPGEFVLYFVFVLFLVICICMNRFAVCFLYELVLNSVLNS